MCSSLIETFRRKANMPQLIIRSIIRNILQETRGPLAFIPILKEWIKVAAKYGQRSEPRIKGPNGSMAETACLRVTSKDHYRVFDSFTPELQEYVLKHWRSREYFSQMISGVTIGIIKQYERKTTGGMKSGWTTMTGGIDADGKVVGSMGGYLTARIERGYTWQGRGSNVGILNNRGQINTDKWEKMLIDELGKGSGSTMVHEFQHWFQESVIYPGTQQMTPTDSKDIRSNASSKNSRPNYRDIKKIQLMLAKKLFTGVDWNSTMKVRGATAYKLTDPIAFFDSYDPNRIRLGGSISLLEFAFKGATFTQTEDLMKVVVHDYLKLQKHIDSNSLYVLAERVKGARYFNLVGEIGGMLTSKGLEGEEIHSSLSSLRSWSHIHILKSSDFYKTGDLKPNRQPSRPKKGNIPKAAWVLITKGAQRVPQRRFDTSSRDQENKRGIDKGPRPTQWTDRWVEFDAVASEYMVSEVQSIFRNRHYTLKNIVKGESGKFAEYLVFTVAAKIGARGFKHARRKEENQKHIESIAERITDRLIETTEENPYEDWFDSIGKLSNRNISPKLFDKWMSLSGSSRDSSPRGTDDYWNWIFAKASGENV